MPEQFLKPEEAVDVRAVMKQAKKAGAVVKSHYMINQQANFPFFFASAGKVGG